jgi:hypothetical protein
MTFIVDGTNGLTFNNSTVQASAGQVLQVVQGTYSTNTSTSGTTLIDTGVTATITPKFSTSKILVLATMNGVYNVGTSGTGVQLAILRNSTNLNAFCNFTSYTSTAIDLIVGASANYLDSPATTSATTYKIQFARNGGSGAVRVQANSDVSSITLLEIAQ